MRRELSVGWLSALACGGCGAASSPPLPTQVEWQAARAWLEGLRRAEPSKPFGEVVSVSLRDPHTGRTFSARGAVAVDPHRALRMVLVGPAGATAIDVWATAESWRFEIPAAGVRRRGGREDDPSLPVGFFRWWFLGPVDGRLLTSVAVDGGERLVLRRGGDTVDLTDLRAGPRHDVEATRRSEGALDRIVFAGTSFAGAPGDHATYDHEGSGVHVEVSVESMSDAPDPAAFTDPDEPDARGPGGR